MFFYLATFWCVNNMIFVKNADVLYERWVRISPASISFNSFQIWTLLWCWWCLMHQKGLWNSVAYWTSPNWKSVGTNFSDCGNNTNFYAKVVRKIPVDVGETLSNAFVSSHMWARKMCFWTLLGRRYKVM